MEDEGKVIVDASPARTGAGPEPIGPRVWRTVVMVLTYLVLEIAIKAVVIAQLGLLAAGRSPSAWLRRRGDELAEQIHGMWRYLSCSAPEAPWPFAPWPRAAHAPAERRAHGPLDA